MPDIRELGRLTKQKYPGVYDGLDDAEVGRRVKQKFPGAYDQFADLPAQGGFLDNLGRNITNAAQQGYTALRDKAASLGEIAGGIATGDFRPLTEAGQSIVRGVAPVVASLGRPDAGPRYLAESVAQARPLAEIQARQDARRAASGDTSFRQRADEMRRLQAEARAFDSSLSGRVTRGVVREGVKLLPTIGAGLVSGGSVPAIAAATALSSFDEPENLVTNTALSAVPVPSARAVTGAVQRLLGRGAAPVAEAAQGGLIRLSGASVDEAAIRAASLPAVNSVVAEAAQQVPQSMARKVADNLAAAYHLPRAVMASADVSAPFRQGAIFTISNPTMAARAGLEMFRAFRTKNFERIAQSIAADADAELGQRVGLHLGSQIRDGLKRGEEAFISKYAGKIPIVKQSENAYIAYLDVLRVQKFKQYRELIDNAGLSEAQRQNGYAAAARWINYATGRGDFGAKVDKMMPLLNTFFFAPKYAMSRLNLLNAGYYAKNAATAEGRIILKQQAKELFKFASVVGSTMYLAKLAGADVSLNPNSPDFLKIKAGTYRYDLGAGLLQAMRLVYRTSADLARVARGDKAERGKTAIDVGERYLRSKLGPVPSWFVDAVKGRTYTGKPYSTAEAIRDRTLPIMWNDWIDAGWEDGVGGILKVTPGAFGIGVSSYQENPQQQGRR